MEMESKMTTKPVIVLPPDTMTDDHIAMLRENGFCVVVASDPAKVRFLDPIPVVSSRTEIESAALSLVRLIFDSTSFEGYNSIQRNDISRAYINILKQGTILDPKQPQAPPQPQPTPQVAARALKEKERKARFHEARRGKRRTATVTPADTTGQRDERDGEWD